MSTMASLQSDLHPITFITNTLPVVQLISISSATLMVLFLSFDENSNKDPRARVQSFFNAMFMNLINDDCYDLIYCQSTLKDKTLK